MDAAVGADSSAVAGCGWSRAALAGPGPSANGPWQTVYERFARWERDGSWARLLEHVQVHDDAVGAVEWTVSVDSTINRAHTNRRRCPQKGASAADELEDPPHRAPGVSERSVERWRRQWREGGQTGGRSKGSPGRPRLSHGQVAGLERDLECGPLVHGWADQRWTLARVRR